MADYPSWICADCGRKHGRIIPGHCATFHMGDPCGWCGASDKAVTEPRDYRYPTAPKGGRDGG